MPCVLAVVKRDDTENLLDGHLAARVFAARVEVGVAELVEQLQRVGVARGEFGFQLLHTFALLLLQAALVVIVQIKIGRRAAPLPSRMFRTSLGCDGWL